MEDMSADYHLGVGLIVVHILKRELMPLVKVKTRTCYECGKPSFGHRCNDCYTKDKGARVNRWLRHRGRVNGR